MRLIRWCLGILLAAIGVWAAGLANLIVAGVFPTPLAVCQRIGVCETKRDIFSSEQEKADQRAPDRFDFGYPDHRINAPPGSASMTILSLTIAGLSATGTS